jgi:hypothetical protein
MATWKKVAISGSNISQFNNDSDYIIDGQSGVSLTGSFSGSFIGTTDLPELTQGNGITFTYDGPQLQQLIRTISSNYWW